jgi:hypothetical protein
MMEEGRNRGFPPPLACSQFDRGLAGYLEGEDRPFVPAHAQECPVCRAILTDLEQILFAGRQLQLEEPPSRVCANFRASLAEQGAFRQPLSGWRRWFDYPALLPQPVPIAALAAAVILGAVLLFHSRAFETNFTSGSRPQDTVQVAGATYASNDDLARTLADMETSYRSREKVLDPSVKVIYQKSLRSIDNSINECRESVRREPANDLAHEYLLSAYAQKAQLLASALEFEGP